MLKAESKLAYGVDGKILLPCHRLISPVYGKVKVSAKRRANGFQTRNPD